MSLSDNPRPSPGSGKPQRLYLSGDVHPMDNGILRMEYQASDVQRPPLKALVESCNIQYNYDQNDTGRMTMSRYPLAGSNKKEMTIAFPDIMSLAPADVIGVFDSSMVKQTAFKGMRVTPNLEFDQDNRKFKLTLPGFVTISQEISEDPQSMTVPFFTALGFVKNQMMGYKMINAGSGTQVFESIEFPLQQALIRTTGKNMRSRMSTSEENNVSFEEDCAIKITYTTDRFDFSTHTDFVLSEIVNKDNATVLRYLTAGIESMLETLNLPEQVIGIENNSIGRKKAGVGNVKIELSDYLVQVLDTNVTEAVIGLFSTNRRGATIDIGMLSGNKLPALDSIFPVNIVGSGLSTASITYVQGFGYTSMVCQMPSKSQISSTNTFILTGSRGYMMFRLLDKAMKPLENKFTVTVNMVVLLMDSEFEPRT